MTRAPKHPQDAPVTREYHGTRFTMTQDAIPFGPYRQIRSFLYLFGRVTECPSFEDCECLARTLIG